jgi:hypothetical protein
MQQKPTLSAKSRIIEIVQQQPETSSFDDILPELAFARMIERGLADADAGRVVPHDVVVRESKTWPK